MSHTSFAVPRKPVPQTAIRHTIDDEAIDDEERFLHHEKPETSLEARKPLVKQSFVSVWWLEAACCAFAVAMILALLLTLLPFRKQKPTYNLPYHLSVNTLISIYMTILKACGLLILTEGLGQLKWNYFRERRPIQHFTRYDAASRGPWGCVQLLVSLKGRRFLTSLGAISSILFLAVDPFAQQLVQYYSCEIAATNGSTASIPRSTIYYEENPRHPTDDPNLTIAQRSAFANGYFNPKTVQVPVGCSSGNCSFPEPFTTIGFCSQCLDVTNELRHFWTNTTEKDSGWYQSALPSGLSTWTGSYFNTSGSTVDTDSVLSVGTYQQNLSLIIELIYDQSEYAVPMFHDCPVPDNETWGCHLQGALRCSITPCVKVLEANFTNGVLIENEVAFSTDWGVGDDSPVGWAELSMADLSCVNDTIKDVLRSMGFNVSGQRFIPWTMDTYSSATPSYIGSYGLPNTTANPLMIPVECIYNMPYNTVQGLPAFAAGFLNGTISTVPSRASLIGSAQALRLLDVTNTSLESVSKPFANIAEALTVQARNWQCADGEISPHKDSCNPPALGGLLLPATCIRVRWPWMAYPATIVLMTLLFFLILITHTEITAKDSFTRGWKTSLLPLIYHGLDERTGNENQLPIYSDDIRHMDLAAETDTAYLIPQHTSMKHL